jgi:hypothetical protein
LKGVGSGEKANGAKTEAEGRTTGWAKIAPTRLSAQKEAIETGGFHAGAAAGGADAGMRVRLQKAIQGEAAVAEIQVASVPFQGLGAHASAGAGDGAWRRAPLGAAAVRGPEPCECLKLAGAGRANVVAQQMWWIRVRQVREAGVRSVAGGSAAHAKRVKQPMNSRKRRFRGCKTLRLATKPLRRR